MGKYRTLGTKFDNVYRNDLNANFDEIDKDIKDVDNSVRNLKSELDNAVETVSNEAFNKVVDAAKITWASPVDTVDDLPTKYPDAEVGLTAMVRDTGKVYRYEGLMWKEIQDIDPTAINEVDSRLTSQLAQTETDVYDRGVNLRSLGLKLDGVADEGQLVMDALSTYKNVVVPGGAIIGTTKTIVVGQGQSLVGLTDNIRGYGKTARIKYIGELDRKKAVIQIGRNAVGAEPTFDGTDIVFKNFLVDGNNLVGIGVYGTHVTNDSVVENIVTSNTLEYAFFFARSWHAKYNRLVALNNKGNGIALGMPLEYQDGTSISWSTSSPFDMNNCNVEDLRANGNGKYYSEDNQNTYTPTDPNIRRKGYGIGLGCGASFNVTKITSERNGGVGLYVYNNHQPSKSIKYGYIENNCLNSGLNTATDMAHMIIENTSEAGGNYYIEDIYMHYNHGGIYHTGVLGRKGWLKNIQQPRFLKSLDGLTAFQLYAEVLKESCYTGMGYYNTLENAAKGIDTIVEVNTKNSSFENLVTKPTIGYKLIFVKGDGTTPFGSYRLNYDDGTNAIRSFPTDLGTDYVLATVANGNLVSITKAGATGATDSRVTFKVVDTPYTFI